MFIRGSNAFQSAARWLCLFCASSALSVQAQAQSYSAATANEHTVSVVAIADYHGLLDLFEQFDYTDESWLEGRRDVPRIYLSGIPERWGKVTSHDITVTLKKRLFFRALGPLVLRSNETIQADRVRLLALQKHDTLSADDSAWLATMASQYRAEGDTQQALLEDLIVRVDVLPPSLILAQAAEESGWGTSRFAFTGNALFGQWTWGDDGIVPEQQRANKGNYKIARFDSPLESVQAHALNLNAHPAYAGFRALRRQHQEAGTSLSGMEAATTLQSYSERGEAYVDSLQAIIRVNRLQGADAAYLRKMRALVIVAQQEDDSEQEAAE